MPRGRCVPSPACGRGIGRGHQQRFVPARPRPNPPPQAGEGGDRACCSRCVLLLARMLLAPIPLQLHTFCPTITDSRSRSRGAFFAPGVCFAASLTPIYGVGGAPRVVGCLRGTRGACTIGAGQAPSEAPCVPIRGTLASRRSTVAIFGSGAALPSPAFAPDRSQRAPRSGS
jgi:hypothetical protein